MLPALAAYNLPFPLGGTSNHFRRAILQSFGGWDPFNVTEDADLGLRLARAGYETATLDSVTLEESVVGLGNWLKQRARWFKGFLQTWLVHTRQPIQYLLEVGPAAFWVTQVMTAGVFLSALLHPLCLAVVLWPLLALAETAAPADLMATILAALGLVVLVAGYAVSMMLGVEGLRRTGRGLWWFTIATMPVYWLLMSLAAWMALWQFAFAPSYWNKTQHGLSRHHRRRRADRQ